HTACRSSSRSSARRRLKAAGVSERLFESAYPTILRSARVRTARLLPRTRDRVDVEQEIVVAVWLPLPKYDERRASLPTFIERVASNKAAALVRHACAKRRIISALPVFDDVNLFGALELHLDIERALQRLKAEDQRVARLLCTLTPQEVAR